VDFGGLSLKGACAQSLAHALEAVHFGFHQTSPVVVILLLPQLAPQLSDSYTGTGYSDVVHTGEDLIEGGAGPDLLLGDAQYAPYSRATALPYSEGLTQSFIWNSAAADMTHVSADNYEVYPVMIPSGNAFSWTWSVTTRGDISLSNPAGLVSDQRVVSSGGGGGQDRSTHRHCHFRKIPFETLFRENAMTTLFS
jgi:hypothetical protein